MKFVANTMEMTRGDGETLTYKNRDKVTKAFIPLVTGDTVRFTVRRTARDPIKHITKTVTTFVDGLAFITILPADTSAMEFGRYFYDVEVTFADGTPKTPVKGTFIVGEEATYA